jgi:FkbM family methyltransferase
MIHRILRAILYNKWAKKIFFPRGVAGKINGETIRIPLGFHRYYPSVYEEEKTWFIKKHCRPGSTAIDIGAHIGIFSFFLAKQVGKKGRVYSFEPSPFTFGVLQQTVKYNGLQDIIEPRMQVVSNSHGNIPFFLSNSSDISNANSINMKNIPDGNAKRIMIPAIMLDDFLNDAAFSHLSFVKIDAEGAEFEILKGATALIKKYRPYMTLEIHPNTFEDPVKTQGEMFDLISSLDYKMQRNDKPIGRAAFSAISKDFEVMLIPG